MARKEGNVPTTEEPTESTETLRAKYFDYCSAQIADLLLMLPPDEIYLLAEQARRHSGSEQHRYGDLVWLATEGIRERLVLPPFEEWVKDYRQHPEHYERYFLLTDA